MFSQIYTLYYTYLIFLSNYSSINIFTYYYTKVVLQQDLPDFMPTFIYLLPNNPNITLHFHQLPSQCSNAQNHLLLKIPLQLQIISLLQYTSINSRQQDLKLLWTKCYYPTSSWQQISAILKSNFNIEKNPHVLKHRYEHYLNVPAITNFNRQEMEKNKGYPFIGGENRKNPEEFLELYRQIKQYHQKTTANKRQETYQKQIIKKQLYPNFQQSLLSFQSQASKYLKVHNLSEEYDLLRLKETQELTEEQAIKLQKIEKIYYKSKQMRLQNQKKISKLHRIIRNIISAESRCFAEDILINQMNIGKFLIKVLKNVFHNCGKLARKILQREKNQGKNNNRNYSRDNYNFFYENGPGMNEKNKSVLPNQNSSSGLSQTLLLQDFTNIERFYSQNSQPLFRKDIIKLYYFPPAQKQDRSSKPTKAPSQNSSQLYHTADGETISIKRLIFILKMFKKIDLTYTKKNLKTENEIKMEIASIQNKKQWEVSQDGNRYQQECIQSPFDTEDKNYHSRNNHTRNQRSTASFKQNQLQKQRHYLKPQSQSRPPTKRYLSTTNPMVIAIPNPDNHLQMIQQRQRYIQMKRNQQAIKGKNKYSISRSILEQEQQQLQIIGEEEYYNETQKQSACNQSQISYKTQKKKENVPMGIRTKEDRTHRIDQWRDQYSKITEPMTDSLNENKKNTKRNLRRQVQPHNKLSGEELSPFQLQKTPQKIKNIHYQQNLQQKQHEEDQPFESPFDALERQRKEKRAKYAGTKSKVVKKNDGSGTKPKKQKARKNTAKRGKKYQCKSEANQQQETNMQQQKQGSLIDALTEPLQPLSTFVSKPMTLDQAVTSRATLPVQNSRDYLLGMLNQEISGNNRVTSQDYRGKSKK